MLINGIFMLPNVLMMFLLGLYFGKQGIFGQLEAHRKLVGILAAVGLPLGIVRPEHPLCVGYFGRPTDGERDAIVRVAHA